MENALLIIEVVLLLAFIFVVVAFVCLAASFLGAMFDELSLGYNTNRIEKKLEKMGRKAARKIIERWNL